MKALHQRWFCRLWCRATENSPLSDHTHQKQAESDHRDAQSRAEGRKSASTKLKTEWTSEPHWPWRPHWSQHCFVYWWRTCLHPRALCRCWKRGVRKLCFFLLVTRGPDHLITFCRCVCCTFSVSSSSSPLSPCARSTGLVGLFSV